MILDHDVCVQLQELQRYEGVRRNRWTRFVAPYGLILLPPGRTDPRCLDRPLHSSTTTHSDHSCLRGRYWIASAAPSAPPHSRLRFASRRSSRWAEGPDGKTNGPLCLGNSPAKPIAGLRLRSPRISGPLLNDSAQPLSSRDRHSR
jgi:hypothetical protein